MEKKNLEKIYNIFLKKKSVKIDSREVRVGDIFFAISGENFNGNIFAKNSLFLGARLVILDDEKIFKKLREDILSEVENATKGSNRSKKSKNFLSRKNWKKTDLEKIILVKNSLETLQNLAKKYRSNLKIPFLGITGSNGKTTTKELIKKVLDKKYNVLATRGNLNNHIGVPLTILSTKPKHNFAIIEMGANHIGEIKFLTKISQPDFGIITNIGKAHIGEFKSFKNIIKTKKELYDYLKKNNGKIFINHNDEILQKIAKQFSAPQKIFYIKGEKIKSRKFLKIKINKKNIQTKMLGDYNIFNLESAFSVGKFFKISEKKIVHALENYKPKNNRSQILKIKNNEFFLDCYNANPSSMELSIESFLKINSTKEKIFILGHMVELGNYSKLEHKKILEKNKNFKTFFVGKLFFEQKKYFKNKNFTFFKDVVSLIIFLKKEKLKNKFFLIKGSNSVNLKNIIEEY